METSALTEHIDEGLVVLQDQRVVFVNCRASEILAATKAEIIATGLVNRIHRDDQAALAEHLQRRLLVLDVARHHLVRLELARQPMKWLELGDNLVPWNGGQGLLVFFLDVTQRHNSKSEARAALDRQQEIHDLQSRIVAMAGHEFRTPLAAILSSQELLQYFGDRLPPDQKAELLGLIGAAVTRLTRLLENTLRRPDR